MINLCFFKGPKHVLNLPNLHYVFEDLDTGNVLEWIDKLRPQKLYI